MLRLIHRAGVDALGRAGRQTQRLAVCVCVCVCGEVMIRLSGRLTPGSSPSLHRPVQNGLGLSAIPAGIVAAQLSRGDAVACRGDRAVDAHSDAPTRVRAGDRNRSHAHSADDSKSAHLLHALAGRASKGDAGVAVTRNAMTVLRTGLLPSIDWLLPSLITMTTV